MRVAHWHLLSVQPLFVKPTPPHSASHVCSTHAPVASQTVWLAVPTQAVGCRSSQWLPASSGGAADEAGDSEHAPSNVAVRRHANTRGSERFKTCSCTP